MTEIKVDNIVNVAGTGKPNFPVAPTHSTGSALSTLNTYQYDTTTRVVTVVDDNGTNKFAIDGVTAPTITLLRGVTYTFDVSDSSVSTHPLAFKNAGTSYTTGVTSSGTAGTTGATVTFAVAADAPLTGLTYYCTTHGDGMGSSVTTSDPKNGAMLWDGAVKFYVDSEFKAIGSSSSTSEAYGDIVVYSGGYNHTLSANENTIEYISIPTAGNAQDFGDLTYACYEACGGSNGTTGINYSGRTASDSYGHTGIDSWTFATTGNATDFGDPHLDCQSSASAWNTNRVLIAGGIADVPVVSPINRKLKGIQYVAIATTTIAAYNGDLGTYKSGHAATADATRAIFSGGNAASDVASLNTVDNMEYVTIDTQGNAQDFGDLLEDDTDNSIGLVADGTKGYFCGWIGDGYQNGSPSYYGRYRDKIQVVTIQTLGNATDFGNLTAVIGYSNQASNSSHGVVMGGTVGGSGSGTGDFARIDKFTLGTASTATDFGDLSAPKSRGAASSGS